MDLSHAEAMAEDDTRATRCGRGCIHCGSFFTLTGWGTPWHFPKCISKKAEELEAELADARDEVCEFCKGTEPCCQPFDNSYGQMVKGMITVCTGCWNGLATKAHEMSNKLALVQLAFAQLNVANATADSGTVYAITVDADKLARMNRVVDAVKLVMISQTEIEAAANSKQLADALAEPDRKNV